MTLGQAAVYYVVDFIFMVGIVVGGVVIGKKLRDAKDKNASTDVVEEKKGI